MFPADAPKNPAAHGAQPVCPVAFWYVPGRHSVRTPWTHAAPASQAVYAASPSPPTPERLYAPSGTTDGEPDPAGQYTPLSAHANWYAVVAAAEHQ